MGLAAMLALHDLLQFCRLEWGEPCSVLAVVWSAFAARSSSKL